MDACELNPGPFQEQQLILTEEPSLQHYILHTPGWLDLGTNIRHQDMGARVLYADVS